MQDEKIKERLHSEEYQSILRKAFRGWSRIDSEAKHAAGVSASSHGLA
jgi:hypothetical protein